MKKGPLFFLFISLSDTNRGRTLLSLERNSVFSEKKIYYGLKEEKKEKKNFDPK
jgi:hypothetical protein